MSEILSETEGCNLLSRLFRARGYSIERNLMFREYGVEFHIDGWDAKARVGFEFLSSEDGDHEDLSLAEYQTLMVEQRRGELSLFIIDEVEPLSAADLAASAGEFLDEVAAARDSRRRAATGKRATTGKAPATPKRAAKRTAKAAKGTAKSKGAAQPAATKKPVAAAKRAAQKRAASKTAAVKKAPVPRQGSAKVTLKVAPKGARKPKPAASKRSAAKKKG
ncbi:MAG: hypothetical protein DWH79_12020 [Planctomycetota bacterium]|nr:MAG: hypothetical protein DWH79_12020 [Planctomycetota bacterium]